ncbi:hypothetical protein [Alicyclobacillus macrosporangiidus]|uniref:Uncharacterized protein n=1 Tax=Alicyclobacillus macrosporangiidus TaxID=392015 RepID=A0A1I7KD13_9BACL|nr:hypothetical protein [Alicyclobacillus macrosporangiidus]SFU95289.1 hypothetical protein SAMN05421543_11540 [Alicyclobacillus macrosporangiidus]
MNHMLMWLGGGGVFTAVVAATLISELRKSKRGSEKNETSVSVKPKKVRPLQEFLPVERAEPTGEIQLVGGGYRRLIRVGNINPYALSEAEIRSIRDHFQTMFGMFHNPVQFIVQGRRMDLTDYRQDFQRTYTRTAEKWGSDLLLEYGRHVEAHLVDQGNKQRTVRENLFITQVDAGLIGTKDPDDLLRVLNQETETALSGLTRCRVSPQIMSLEESIEALQFFWNRDRVHARARDAVRYGGLKEYLTGEEEVKLDALVSQRTSRTAAGKAVQA